MLCRHTLIEKSMFLAKLIGISAVCNLLIQPFRLVLVHAMAHSQPTYNSIKNSEQTVKYGINDVGFIAFGHKGKRFLLTSGLNGCFNVLIVSLYAAIGVHIPPRPVLTDDTLTGDQNLINKMKQVAQLWVSNRKFFPDPNDVVVMYARFEGSVAPPDKKTLIEKCLNRMGLGFTTEDYIVKNPDEPRADEHGTAFVDGGSRPRPTLYLENKLLVTSSSSVVSFANQSTAPFSKEAQATPKSGAQQNPGLVGTADSGQSAFPVNNHPVLTREQHTVSQSVSEACADCTFTWCRLRT